MRKLGFLVAGLLVALVSNAQSSQWEFDAAHSGVRFGVSHMVISEVEGKFSKFDGEVTSSKADFSDAKISFTIDVASVDTDNADRDEHLRNEDFFDVAKFPTMTFVSKSMDKVSDNKYKLTGDFTMLGVTKEISLEAKYGGTVQDPWGNTKAGFKVTGEIDRTDFGLKYNSKMDTGGLLLGEVVEIVCNIELKKK